MVNWFRRERRRVEVPRLRPRSGGSSATTRVDLAELTPDLMSFLGRAAYVQLMIFENLSRVVATAPTTSAKSSLSRATAIALERYEALAAEIRRNGKDPGEAMDASARTVDRFQAVITGRDWHESLITCYVTAGFLDDFFLRLAAGLSESSAEAVAAALSGDSGERLIAAQLAAAIEGDPRLAARLALWGRRLVGDTMLIARSSLAASDNHDSDEARIEPVFTELIAAHTRRMDVLGLTA